MRSLFIVLILTSSSLYAQLESPASFLGYELGERFTRHHKVVEYFRNLAEALPNVKLNEYGETYEHRPLFAAIISSQENINNWESIRKNNLR